MCIVAFLGYFESEDPESKTDGKSLLVNYVFTVLLVGFTLITLVVPWKVGAE